jgi:hypothetical protein
VLNITKDFKKTESVSVIIRFGLTVNGHEVTGECEAWASDGLMDAGSIVKFDNSWLMYESGLFSPDEKDEIIEFVQQSIDLPKIAE